ncbi:MAG: phosphoserine phosphatase SerB [Betaproteobacteria bacterium 13_1_40CM_4_64_4]|nr:MAG: phosphoserine phosphatase SerB [Betaproteobacteria bacterium 13_1_40CM_4_64_4]
MVRTDLVIQAPDIDTPQIKQLARLAEADTITALSGASTQAFRLSPARQRAGVAELCAVADIDFGFVPDDQRLERVRLVAMDMDSTLISIECIDEIADMRGIKPEIAAITASAMRGEIDFRESLKRRVALLAGLDMAALSRVYDERLRLSPGAERMLAGFARAGAKTLLVSGGFTFFTDKLKARLGFDHAVASTLEIAGGRLTGRISGEIVDGEVKAAAFARLGRELKGDHGLIVAIGDGANDLPLLRLADVSVAYHAKPIVRAETTYAIDYCGLDAVLNLFG